MGKKISQRMTYDADPATVFAMYIDPAFIQHKNEKTGGFDVQVSVDATGQGGVLTVSRKLPADLPAFAKRFTGEAISMRETDTWQPTGPDGVRHGKLVLEFPGTPMQGTGTFRLEPIISGTSCQVDIELKASVPIVGGKLEEVTAAQVLRAIGAEERIGREWLTIGD